MALLLDIPDWDVDDAGAVENTTAHVKSSWPAPSAGLEHVEGQANKSSKKLKKKKKNKEAPPPPLERKTTDSSTESSSASDSHMSRNQRRRLRKKEVRRTTSVDSSLGEASKQQQQQPNTTDDAMDAQHAKKKKGVHGSSQEKRKAAHTDARSEPDDDASQTHKKKKKKPDADAAPTKPRAKGEAPAKRLAHVSGMDDVEAMDGIVEDGARTAKHAKKKKHSDDDDIQAVSLLSRVSLHDTLSPTQTKRPSVTEDVRQQQLSMSSAGGKRVGAAERLQGARFRMLNEQVLHCCVSLTYTNAL